MKDIDKQNTNYLDRIKQYMAGKTRLEQKKSTYITY